MILFIRELCLLLSFSLLPTLPTNCILPPGIDINAGCGQLKSELLRKKRTVSPAAGAATAVSSCGGGSSSATVISASATDSAGKVAVEESEFDASIAKSAV